MSAALQHTAPIRIEARWHKGRIDDVRIHNRRPHASRLLLDRPARDAVALVPRLFSLCSQAQGLAARAACAAAGATAVVGPTRDEAIGAIAAENLREHLGRLLLDWPALFGETPARETFARLFRALADPCPGTERTHAAATEVIGLIDRCLAVGEGRAASTIDSTGAATPGRALAAAIGFEVSANRDTVATPLLHPRPAADWMEQFDQLTAPGFAERPIMDGAACETGPLVRHAGAEVVARLIGTGNRVAARLFARAVDALACAHLLRQTTRHDPPTLVDAATAPGRCGLAWVETARGLLVHAVRLDGERIAEYTIVAPTEWNLHPHGALTREGNGWNARTPAQAVLALRALALSLDPCVDFEVELRSEAHA